MIFLPLDVFYVHKNPAFFAFCWLVCFLLAQNLFLKKKNKTKKFKITLIASINNNTQ